MRVGFASVTGLHTMDGSVAIGHGVRSCPLSRLMTSETGAVEVGRVGMARARGGGVVEDLPGPRLGPKLCGAPPSKGGHVA